MGKYFGTDGIRRHAEEFDCKFLAGVVEGLIDYYGSNNFSLLLGGDTRKSTQGIIKDLAELASARGIKCVSVGVLPTPAINFCVQEFGQDFAIDVTASHNPATYNGLKIFENKDGVSEKLGAEGREKIEQKIDAENNVDADFQAEPAEDWHEKAIEAYLNHLWEYVGEVDLSNQKIALDCANGATSVVAERAFQKYGAELVVKNNDETFGTKINDNCGSTHLEELQKIVAESNANFGAAFDGDGDRCLFVDGNGQEADGDKTLTILAKYLNLSGLVTTVMANQGLLNWARENQIDLEITDVGDQNVYARMQEQNIGLGGEQSGHIILPGEPMGDGILTALMMAKVVSESGELLSELANQIPQSPQIMINIPANSLEKIALENQPAQEVIQQYDTKVAEINGRLLVRPSGTEDLIRLTMWGDDATEIKRLVEELKENLQEVIHG